MKLKIKNFAKEIQWLLKEKYGGKLTPAARKDIKRLEKGEPIDYVIGFVEFLGCKIDLSQKSFIPEPETEYWVGEAINKLKIKNQKSKIKILDIFAGSGCIGIAVLKNIKNTEVHFAEKENKFLKQIEINLNMNGVSKKRYKIIQSDVFSGIKGDYDYIFANPPYISKENLKKVQKPVLKYEPKMAIFGKKDGLFYIRKFLKEAKKHLKRDGLSQPVRQRANGVRASKIYMELDSCQKKETENLLKKFGYENYQFFKDQFNKWRYLVAE